jgi:hypothetical protein
MKTGLHRVGGVGVGGFFGEEMGKMGWEKGLRNYGTRGGRCPGWRLVGGHLSLFCDCFYYQRSRHKYLQNGGQRLRSGKTRVEVRAFPLTAKGCDLLGTARVTVMSGPPAAVFQKWSEVGKRRQAEIRGCHPFHDKTVERMGHPTFVGWSSLEKLRVRHPPYRLRLCGLSSLAYGTGVALADQSGDMNRPIALE